MNTVTIQDKNKIYTLVVKDTFLDKCSDPSKHTFMELAKDYNVLSYLHNEHGPAATRHESIPPSKELLKLVEENKYFLSYNEKNERIVYWIDGHNISRENVEQAKKLHRNINFKKKTEEWVNNE